MSSTIPIRTHEDRERAIRRIQNAEMPCTVTVTKGAPRSIEQNRLQRLWMRELEDQGDMTAEEYRGYCKAYFGIPILLANDEAFADQYERIIRPLPYAQKLEIMQQPIDFPVTRLMTTKQKREYLDKIYVHWTGKGFSLTNPDWQGVEVK